jgi:hypothetical protein
MSTLLYARFQHSSGAWFPGDSTIAGQSCIAISTYVPENGVGAGKIIRKVKIAPINASTAAVQFAKAAATGEHLPCVEVEEVQVDQGRQNIVVKFCFLNAIIAQVNRTGSMVGLLSGQEHIVVAYEEMKIVYGTPAAELTSMVQRRY